MLAEAHLWLGCREGVVQFSYSTVRLRSYHQRFVTGPARFGSVLACSVNAVYRSSLALCLSLLCVTDVGMHGLLASQSCYHYMQPPCWFTLRASDRFIYSYRYVPYHPYEQLYASWLCLPRHNYIATCNRYYYYYLLLLSHVCFINSS